MLLEEELSQQARENQADAKAEIGHAFQRRMFVASRWSFIACYAWLRLEQPPTMCAGRGNQDGHPKQAGHCELIPNFVVPTSRTEKKWLEMDCLPAP